MKSLKKLIGSRKDFFGHLPDDKLEAMGYERNQVEPTLEQIEYFKKLHKDSHIYDYDDKHRKWLIFQRLNDLTGGYDLTKENKKLMIAIYKSFKDSQKGLILTGQYGVGKTTLLKGFISVPFKSITVQEWENVRPRFFKAQQIVDFYGDGSDLSWYQRFIKSDLVIDDIGREGNRRFSGTNPNPRDKPVYQLIDYYESHGKGRLYLTTNCTDEQLIEHYDNAILSRISGLCNKINFGSIGVDKDYRLK